MTSRRSSTSTCRPARARYAAATRPLWPAPTTIASGGTALGGLHPVVEQPRWRDGGQPGGDLGLAGQRLDGVLAVGQRERAARRGRVGGEHAPEAAAQHGHRPGGAPGPPPPRGGRGGGGGGPAPPPHP